MARRDALKRGTVSPEATTNLALWLDRYAWDFEQKAIGEHQTATLDKVRVPEGYEAAFVRRKAALRQMAGAFVDGATRLYDLTLQGRAVVGIGAASVRETNLSLLRPWGVPYIPGSGLKGITSQLAHEAGDEWKRPAEPGKDAGKFQQAIFGDVKQAGAVVFHDAWWVPSGDRAPVSADTMTVHHVDYYTGKGDAPPADWDEPNPVSFLTMHGSYLAALTGPPEALDIAERLLTEALATQGVGAKRSAGYGRATLAAHLSPVLKSIEAFKVRTVAANDVAQTAQHVLQLANQVMFEDERRALRTRVKALCDASAQVWAKWAADPKRTPEERSWFVFEQPAPAAAAPAAVVASVNPWHTGRAYIEVRGKQRIVKVSVGGFDLEQPANSVTFVDEGLEAELAGAQTLPARERPKVQVQLDRADPRKGAKPRSIRRPV